MARRARCRRSRQLLWSAGAGGFFDTLHEQPLVLGALGLAAGAAIGAALPTTDKEDEWLGDSRDRLKERAKEAGWEQVEKARAAAGAAYSAARGEAERQGLTLEGGKAAASPQRRPCATKPSGSRRRRPRRPKAKPSGKISATRAARTPEPASGTAHHEHPAPPPTVEAGGGGLAARRNRSQEAAELAERGRQADRPSQIPTSGWRDILLARGGSSATIMSR